MCIGDQPDSPVTTVGNKKLVLVDLQPTREQAGDSGAAVTRCRGDQVDLIDQVLLDRIESRSLPLEGAEVEYHLLFLLLLSGSRSLSHMSHKSYE